MSEISAPTPADVGRVYTLAAGSQALRGGGRRELTLDVVLVNDREVATDEATDFQVAVKPLMPAESGTWPVRLVDYRKLTATDQRIGADR